VTFSAGLAIAGLKPVTAIYSTFMQRAVDQVIHDLALQRLPVIIAMDRAGLVPDDGETHQGLYDIPLFRAVPHLSFLAPADHVEMDLMLRWALRAVDGPVLLRYPKSACPDTGSLLDRPVETGRGVMVKKNDGDLLLISVGGLFQEAREAVHLSARRGIGVDLFNLRFIKPIDEEYLASVMKSYARVFLVEDGAQAGGIGEYIAGMVHRLGLKLEFRWAGVPDTFLCQASRAELIQTAGLDRYSIAERIGEMLSSSLSIVRPRRDLAASE
jgi:1-deoxy-D-xylulose-5-phosphate synthase